MTQPHPLFDTFRAAEELANAVDQHLLATPAQADEAQGAARRIRQATALLMLHLVESFPRGGRTNTRESLGQAREFLIQLTELIRALTPRMEIEGRSIESLLRSCDRVITKLAFTMAWIDDQQPTTVTRRLFPGPLNVSVG